MKDGDVVPDGFLKGFVNDVITPYIKVTGLVDIKNQLQRLQKKIDELNKRIGGIEKAISKYNDKVPQKVKDDNAEKLSKAKFELADLDKQYALLSSLK